MLEIAKLQPLHWSIGARALWVIKSDDARVTLGRLRPCKRTPS